MRFKNIIAIIISVFITKILSAQGAYLHEVYEDSQLFPEEEGISFLGIISLAVLIGIYYFIKALYNDYKRQKERERKKTTYNSYSNPTKTNKLEPTTKVTSSSEETDAKDSYNSEELVINNNSTPPRSSAVEGKPHV